MSIRFSLVEKSFQLPITTGVPQRSVLGPFIFLIYINDSPVFCKKENKIAMFVDDDTSILNSADENVLNLYVDLNKMVDWFSYKNLSGNISIFESMHFGCGISKDSTNLDKTVSMKTHCKYLHLQVTHEIRIDEIEQDLGIALSHTRFVPYQMPTYFSRILRKVCKYLWITRLWKCLEIQFWGY